MFVKQDRPQTKIWRMRNVCWIPRARNKLTGGVKIIGSPLQLQLHQRAPVLQYMFIVLLTCGNIFITLY